MLLPPVPVCKPFTYKVTCFRPVGQLAAMFFANITPCFSVSRRSLQDMPFFGHLVKEASSGPCCALVLCRVEAVMVLQQLMGHESVKEARGRTGDAVCLGSFSWASPRAEEGAEIMNFCFIMFIPDMFRSVIAEGKSCFSLSPEAVG